MVDQLFSLLECDLTEESQTTSEPLNSYFLPSLLELSEVAVAKEQTFFKSATHQRCSCLKSATHQRQYNFRSKA
ncbi:hypothetical protein FKM82_010841 [Ascaphus truei]